MSKPNTPPWPVRAYTETITALRTIQELAGEERRVGVVIGEAGSGKSFAIRDFSLTCDQTRVMVVPPTALLTTRSLLEAVAEGLGIRGARYTHQMRFFDKILVAVKARQAFLIVDEADRLTPKFADLLRAIADESGQALCLSGCPGLEGVISKVAPVATRVVIRHRVPPVSPQEAIAVLGHGSGFAEEHGLRTWDGPLLEVAVKEVSGNMRLLHALLAQVELVEKGGTQIAGRDATFQSVLVRKLVREYLWVA